MPDNGINSSRFMSPIEDRCSVALVKPRRSQENSADLEEVAAIQRQNALAKGRKQWDRRVSERRQELSQSACSRCGYDHNP